MIKSIKILLEKNIYIKKLALFLYTNSYGKYKYNKENKLFLSNANKVLEAVDHVYKELDISYWLDFGTLLGAYRNKEFLRHDLDLDIGAYLNEYNAENEKVFIKHGFKKIKSFTIDDGIYGREETYQYLGVPIDIFYYTKIDNSGKAYYHDFRPKKGMSRDKTIMELGGLIPREITLALSSIGSISFLGKKYPCPEPVAQHLEDRYGKDYMIENPSWNTDTTANKNIKTLSEKVGIRKIY